MKGYRINHKNRKNITGKQWKEVFVLCGLYGFGGDKYERGIDVAVIR